MKGTPQPPKRDREARLRELEQLIDSKYQRPIHCKCFQLKLVDEETHEEGGIEARDGSEQGHKTDNEKFFVMDTRVSRNNKLKASGT